MERIKDELLDGRDLTKKGSRKRQREYADRTARKAISDVRLTLGARPSNIAPSGWKISHIPEPVALEQLLPFGPQACARANFQDWRESGSHDPPWPKTSPEAVC
jgi:hypothetical protein